MKYTFSSNGIQDYLEDIYLTAWKLYGNEQEADHYTSPVCWYVNTERASTQFIRTLLATEPEIIAKLCMQKGSPRMIVDRVIAFIGTN